MRNVIERPFSVVEAAILRHLVGFCFYTKSVSNPSLFIYWLYDPSYGQPSNQNLGALVLRDLGASKAEVYSSPPPKPTIIDIFSICLDEELRNRKPELSAGGKNFLQRVRISPPFLGLSNGLFGSIGRAVEDEFSFHFWVKTKFGLVSNFLRPASSYQIRRGDSWASISEKHYGNSGFVEHLKAANSRGTLPPKGSYITIPSIDAKNPLLSAEKFRELMSILKNVKSLELQLKIFLGWDEKLTREEVLQIIEIAYYAAQSSLHSENSSKIREQLYQLRVLQHEKIMSGLSEKLLQDEFLTNVARPIKTSDPTRDVAIENKTEADKTVSGTPSALINNKDWQAASVSAAGPRKPNAQINQRAMIWRDLRGWMKLGNVTPSPKECIAELKKKPAYTKKKISRQRMQKILDEGFAGKYDDILKNI